MLPASSRIQKAAKGENTHLHYCIEKHPLVDSFLSFEWVCDGRIRIFFPHQFNADRAKEEHTHWRIL